MGKPFLKVFGNIAKTATNTVLGVYTGGVVSTDSIAQVAGAVTRSQTNMGEAARDEVAPIASGRVITGLTFASGVALSFPHSLGRVPAGVFPVLVEGGTFPRFHVNSRTTTSISMTADAAASDVSVWVF